MKTWLGNLKLDSIHHKAELGCFIVILAVLNTPFFFPAESFALHPSALSGHESWRFATFAWAHISPYHLVLDATAFLCLYEKLQGRLGERLQHLAICILGSGLLPILIDSRLEEIGLRGLSGVAHGLMIVGAREAMRDRAPTVRAFGILTFTGVIAKCALEQLTGTVLFSQWHLGNVGIPIPSCHVGGALGGLLSALAAGAFWSPKNELPDRLAPDSFWTAMRMVKFRLLAAGAHAIFFLNRSAQTAKRTMPMTIRIAMFCQKSAKVAPRRMMPRRSSM